MNKLYFLSFIILLTSCDPETVKVSTKDAPSNIIGEQDSNSRVLASKSVSIEEALKLGDEIGYPEMKNLTEEKAYNFIQAVKSAKNIGLTNDLIRDFSDSDLKDYNRAIQLGKLINASDELRYSKNEIFEFIETATDKNLNDLFKSLEVAKNLQLTSSEIRNFNGPEGVYATITLAEVITVATATGNSSVTTLREFLKSTSYNEAVDLIKNTLEDTFANISSQLTDEEANMLAKSIELAKNQGKSDAFLIQLMLAPGGHRNVLAAFPVVVEPIKQIAPGFLNNLNPPAPVAPQPAPAPVAPQPAPAPVAPQPAPAPVAPQPAPVPVAPQPAPAPVAPKPAPAPVIELPKVTSCVVTKASVVTDSLSLGGSHSLLGTRSDEDCAKACNNAYWLNRKGDGQTWYCHNKNQVVGEFRSNGWYTLSNPGVPSSGTAGACIVTLTETIQMQNGGYVASTLGSSHNTLGAGNSKLQCAVKCANARRFNFANLAQDAYCHYDGVQIGSIRQNGFYQAK